MPPCWSASLTTSHQTSETPFALGPISQETPSGIKTPLLKKDLELVLEWAEKGIVMAGDRELLDKNSDTPQELADYIATWTSGERRPAADEPSGKQSTCS
ncbi:hypothetical protein LTS09_018223, partial [Friedmanniomyces endolithicus]